MPNTIRYPGMASLVRACQLLLRALTKYGSNYESAMDDLEKAQLEALKAALEALIALLPWPGSG